VRFVPLSPTKLVGELADRVQSRHDGQSRGAVTAFDGPAECGVAALADAVAEELRARGAAVIRASTSWWWRPAALRLELGREDVEMLLTGWVDADALRRELVDPVRSGTGSAITRLRDPGTDRSVRQQPAPVSDQTLLLLDGPFLLATELPFDVLVGFQLGRGTLLRSLPPQQHWWTRAFETYDDRYQPLEDADVVLAYDHPSAPAGAGLADSASQRRGRR
jgi:hypothetical protein